MDFTSLISLIWITPTIVLGGDPAIVSLSCAASIAEKPLIIIIIAGYITAVVGEVFWFALTRKLSPGKIRKWNFIKKSYDAYVGAVSKVERKEPLKLLFLARSFYGGGLAAIIYLAGTNLSTKKLVQYSMTVNAFWVSLYVFLGWEAGKGFKYALYLFNDIKIAITIMVIVAVLVYLLLYGIKNFNKIKK